MIAWVVGLCIALVLGGGKPPSPLEILGKLDGRDLPEASGIVKSRRFDGIFWVHNDSGNPPYLFAIRRDGSVVRRYKVEIPNVDWEDIAVDDSGHLYLGDIGNNGGLLPVRAIYQIDEPDPSQPAEGPLKAVGRSFYTFPRDGRFDAEGLFINRGRAILVAKTFDRREAELFALPFDRPGTLLKPRVPTRIGLLAKFREPATGADLSADGEWLAVCSTTAARVYRREEPMAPKEELPVADRWQLVAEVNYPACAIEAICWDGRDLILAGEDGQVSRFTESAWRKGAVVRD